MASSSRSSRNSECSMTGIGSVGSSAMVPSAAQRHLADEVHGHARDRAERRQEPLGPRRVPMYATATDANALPRRNSGSSGSGGNW